MKNIKLLDVIEELLENQQSSADFENDQNVDHIYVEHPPKVKDASMAPKPKLAQPDKKIIPPAGAASNKNKTAKKGTKKLSGMSPVELSRDKDEVPTGKLPDEEDPSMKEFEPSSDMHKKHFMSEVARKTMFSYTDK